MDESIIRIVAEIETQNSISESTLKDLQILLDFAVNNNDSTDLEFFYAELSSRKLSPSSLIDCLSSGMDSGGLSRSNRISLLASNVYLSLILSPNSPVFTLFTPMAFLSLLRSVRRALKNPSVSPGEGSAGDNRGRRKRGEAKNRMRKNKGKNLEDSENGAEDGGFDIKVMLCVLEKLEMVLDLVHLDRFPDSLRSLVQTVAEIPVIANELCGSSGNYDKLCKFCSRILIKVLKSDHGDQGVSASEVLKSLTPLVLISKSQARSFALGFLVNRMLVMAKDSDEIKKAIVNFPKYMVHKSPEKAEPRALAVESIMEVVKILDFEDKIDFADYVVKMSQGKGQFRLLAVDLVLALMMTIKDPLGLNSDNEPENSWGLRCLEALIQRCSDATAAIRARALMNLAQLVGILSVNYKSKAALKELMGVGNEGSNRPRGDVNDLLRKRCTDEKAAVRKASLVLISKLTTLLDGALDEDLLKIVGMACSDSLVSIRKAAISALSEAFRISSDESVTKEWLHSVPRLITDNESSIQEECENLFLELVLDKISKAGSSTSSHRNPGIDDSNGILDRELRLPYPKGVLCILKQLCDGEVTPWVRKLCSSLGKKKKIKAKIVIALQNIIRASESLWLIQSMPIENWTAPPGAWLLLAEVSAFLPKSIDWEFLHHHWKLVDKCKPAAAEDMSPIDQRVAEEEVTDRESNSVAWAEDRVFLLQTISNVSMELPPEPAADLAHNFLKRLQEFNMHSTEVSGHVKALKTLCKRKALNPEEADLLVKKWVHQILSKASNILDMYVSDGREANKDSTFITPPKSVYGKGKKVAASTPALLSQAITAVYTIGSLVIVCPSADLKAIIPVLHAIITSANPDQKSNILPQPAVSVKQAAPSLYIQAWLTMGKICLADGKLAKRYIPLFVQELENSDWAALRNNIVVMMADFCVRYTALVDCYMSKITKCLRDPCELVRRQTFILLARLLQRDYVKWRGVLFLRFLLSLVDESEKIRQLADFLFGNILKVKAPLLAYNSFVEAIFVLNDFNTHTGRSNPQKSKSESSLFSIRGNDENSRSRRMHIYVTLLKQMAQEHLLATFAKICAEILAAASDGMLNVEDATGQSVLQDAFQILSSKEIRIPSNRSTSDSAEAEEDGGEGIGASAAAAAAKGRAISQAVRKGLIQNTVPIFIELKRILESKNSPLIGSLMECLRMLLKDYKNEIDEILVADKQLQKELIYDIQKYESMNAKSTAAEAVATLQRSESFLSPGDPKHPRSGMLNQTKLSEHRNSKVASAVADAVAAARARTVLREVNRGASTPPLSAMSVPKLKSVSTTAAEGEKTSSVIESLRRRQTFDSDDEN